MSAAPPRIAVLGAGITGLAAALRLRELDPACQVRLFEADSRAGGVLRTEHAAGFLVEHAADMFITNVPEGLDLCRRVGLADDVVETNPHQRTAYVLHRGRMVPVPDGFQLMAPTQWRAVAATPLLSLGGKLRVAADLVLPARRGDQDESLADFARRRFGRQAFERLIQPLVGGIYTADPEQLSMRACFARFAELEQQHGSLIRGLLRQQTPAERSASGARYSLFVAPRQGMGSLVEAVVRALPADCLRLGHRVCRLESRGPRRWQVTADQGSGPAPPEEFDGVVVALPGPRAAELLRSVDGGLSEELAAIHYAGASIAVLGYHRRQLPRLPIGFGLVIPETERRRILAISFASAKLPGRAPPDHVLLRVFVGGALHPDLAALPDEDLLSLVREEVADLLGAQGEPCLVRVARWLGAMPQYHVGHLERVARIDAAAARHPGLALAGNALNGVGIPLCIRSGQRAAAAVLAAASRSGT